ncbi:MAG: hypothetical protein K6F72_00550 [Bacteroidales bacterium]|nr:hypothetical protein [Bacteroidales bacterium]
MKRLVIIVLATALLAACGTKDKEPQVEGHYTYEHAFNYDMNGNHFDVQETGTMDFYDDSTALDSARQVYTVTRPEGYTVTFVFNYVSPSRWSRDGEDLYFAGLKDSFRMDCREIRAGMGSDMYDFDPQALSQYIVSIVSGSIDYQYKFHIDSLTADKMQWSFTYRDGHSDTWEFFRAAR